MGKITWHDSNAQADTRYRAQATILVLLELHRICPDVFSKIEIYVDGGFERGSDILKAISLGATAVGIGRPYLYSLAYGEEGVEHLTQSELRLLAVTTGKANVEKY